MANANTNLVSSMIRPTTNSTSSVKNSVRTTRTNPDARNSKSNIKYSSSRSPKNNFDSEFDKATAQVNQSQPDEVQAVAENVESENVNELSKTPTQGKNSKQQDAPKQKNLPKDENSQPVAENLTAENIVAEIITPTIPSQIQPTINVDDSQNIPQNSDVEISMQDTTKLSSEILINPAYDNSEIVKENPTPTLTTDLHDGVIDKVEENLSAQVDSSNIAFYFASSAETLLTVKDKPAEVETTNLMSIMPQARDNKAQSMLNLLSGKTWESPKLETDSTQNLNLQNQQQPVQVLEQPFMIQPQFQPRPLNIPTTPLDYQTPVQVQSQLELQPTLQAQPQTDFQPTFNQPTLQAQPQTDFQPTFNQPTLQAQPQTDFQPTFNQPTLQAQLQTDFQPTFNQPTLQAQPQTDFQPTFNQPTLQAQPQTDFQPTFNQPTLQAQPQTDFQTTLNQPTLQAQSQVQQQQFDAQIQPQINSLQPQIQPQNVNRQVLNDMLGVEVQVEENQPQSTPIMPLQNLSQQFEQNQQFTRNFQQNFTTLTSEVEIESREVPVEAENFASNMAAVNQTQNQPAAQQVQSPEVMQTPREDFNVPAQIVEQARMIRTATNTEMVINLKPEHLGELTLRISVGTNGAVNASFYSDNAQVRAIIENSIVQLKQELNDQGIKVDDVEVYAGLNEDSLLNGQGQQAWQQNQQQRNQRGSINLGAVEEEIDALATPINENLSSDGVDYKV